MKVSWLPMPSTLTRSLQEMRSGGAAKVPIMLGFTKEDGLLTTTSLVKNPEIFQELRSASAYLDTFEVFLKVATTLVDIFFGATKKVLI